MKSLSLPLVFTMAVLWAFSCSGAEPAGVLLYTSPPATYVEAVEYISLRLGTIYSVAGKPDGSSLQIANGGILHDLQYPKPFVGPDSKREAEANISKIQGLAIKYPQCKRKLERLIQRWQAIKVSANSIQSAPVIEEPKTGKNITIGGIAYEDAQLVLVTTEKASILHSAGGAGLSLESLTPQEIKALNSTSQIKIPDDWREKLAEKKRLQEEQLRKQQEASKAKVAEQKSQSVAEVGNEVQSSERVPPDENAAGTQVLSDDVRNAAEKGDAKAQLELGNHYRHVIKDLEISTLWFRRAAEQGLVEAQCQLGYCYLSGDGVDQSPSDALKWFRKAAELGYADAQSMLGFFYSRCPGVVATDHAEAVKWYRAAADQGHAGALFNLSECYKSGTGINKDPSEALRLLRKAAELGDGGAGLALSKSYWEGDAVPKDHAESIRWLRKAADRGNADAEFALAESYLKGRGMPKDRSKAAEWFEKASNHGNTEAKYWMDEYRRNSFDAEDRVFNSFRQGAENGEAFSQAIMGDRYREGCGTVGQDDAEADKWYSKAAAQGDERARDLIGKRMTPFERYMSKALSEEASQRFEQQFYEMENAKRSRDAREIEKLQRNVNETLDRWNTESRASQRQEIGNNTGPMRVAADPVDGGTKVYGPNGQVTHIKPDTNGAEIIGPAGQTARVARDNVNGGFKIYEQDGRVTHIKPDGNGGFEMRDPSGQVSKVLQDRVRGGLKIFGPNGEIRYITVSSP